MEERRNFENHENVNRQIVKIIASEDTKDLEKKINKKIRKLNNQGFDLKSIEDIGYEYAFITALVFERRL